MMRTSHDPPAGARPGAVCFAANALSGLGRGGGLGAYFWSTAHALAARGWRVHLLYASGPVADAAAAADARCRLADAGITLSLLDEHARPPHDGLYRFQGWSDLIRSERVRWALEELHAAQRFDLIEFAEWGGCGFRSVQARRAGLAFADARLLVKLHSSSQQRREANHLWLSSVDDLRTDYQERYSFEHCDVQLAPCRRLLDCARSNQWRVRPDAQVLGGGFPDAPPNPTQDPGEPREVVFFGRLETRKGLEVFLDACDRLPPGLRLTFLGPDADRHDGRPASAWVRERLRGRPAELLLELDREQALAYLRGPGRLAVMPAPADPFPYAVVECATQGIPFVASEVGGAPELIPDPEAQSGLLFQPNPRDLARCLLAYLAAGPDQRRDWSARVRDGADPGRHNDRLDGQYRALLPRPAQAAPPAPPPRPLVTVGVSHYNLGAYLPQTLASLAAQTYPHVEVIVVDDGSDCPQARSVFDEQERLYPNYSFVRQANGGCGAARNAALERAHGALFVPLDADNLFAPHMLEAFVHAMQARPEASALTCYALAFRDGSALEDADFLFCYAPTGGPQALAASENLYGDTNAVHRTEALRSVGGYETERGSMAWLDWMTYLKLVSAGHVVDVIPEALFYYRVRDDGMLRSADADGRGRAYSLQQQLLRRYFAARPLPPAEQAALLAALAGFKHTVGGLNHEIAGLREQNCTLTEQHWALTEQCRALTEQFRVQTEGWRRRAELDRAEAAGWKAILEDTRRELARLRGVEQGLMREKEALACRLSAARYRAADKLHLLLGKVPLLRRGLKGAVKLGLRAWRLLRRTASAKA
jgi:glycosyltransferase involved in cell wall biosynthesis